MNVLDWSWSLPGQMKTPLLATKLTKFTTECSPFAPSTEFFFPRSRPNKNPAKNRRKSRLQAPKKFRPFLWVQTPPSELPLPRAPKTTHGRSSKKPTVGRLDDLRWVASATHRRSLFAPSSEPPHPPPLGSPSFSPSKTVASPIPNSPHPRSQKPRPPLAQKHLLPSG